MSRDNDELENGINSNPNEDSINADFERMVSGARPTLDAVSQNRLSFEAGLAAGRQQSLTGGQSTRTFNAWTLLVSHAVCALAAGWMVFAILPNSATSVPSESLNQTGPSSLASAGQMTSTIEMPTTNSDGILRPMTRPDKFVEFINNREIKSATTDPTSDSEPVLTSRSLLF